ncbi:alpha/beta hydrolase [Actinocorallia sp. API 0066]|uniref:alpha/beta hydrolase n=1 Tax=Actinocorallia sp. API 0066 TaxID=2896846 RepID=UPI001E4C3DBF|nr:alpha/beta hydrolase [Actinocorallia sp. API 0066]MCD0452773.1 alpha/beta hydrolase [Actinocorallia sp. API 0066]
MADAAIEDILGPGYEAREIPLPSDAEGEVVATLVRRTGGAPTRRAVLYVHGFVDYFFQTHLADFYAARGFDFYALDLRKYGRSLRPHQTANMVESLSEYFAELDEAVRIIREDHDVLLVNGHSTGGLITALWADRVQGRGLVQGLFLNSPFFDLNETAVMRAAGVGVARSLRGVRPLAKLPAPLSSVYVTTIHRDFDGEWDFDLKLKPFEGFPVRAGWLAAIRRGQKRVHAGLAIDVPVLVMASTRTVPARAGGEGITGSDIVLDVEHIAKWSPGLGAHVTIVRIENGLHDLVLSAKPARDQVFTELGRWIDAYVPAEADAPA